MKKVQGIILGGIVAIAALAGVNLDGATSHAVRDARDCDGNSIIYCGALSQSELLKKYDENKTKDLSAIYSHYGISRDDIAGKTSEVKLGKVYKDGRVEVDGKVVATGAHSVGRDSAPNSKKVVINGKTYYERMDASGFKADYIDAFVLMRGGEFYRAVLTSCSNPLVAVPTPKPTPKPEYSCDAIRVEKISRTEYRFVVSAKATGGATVESYRFDYGDGTTENSTTATATHIFERDIKHTVTVSVDVKVNGKVQSVTGANCTAAVVVSPEMCERNPSLPKDDERCALCEIPGKETYPKDSPECKAAPVKPAQELPKTGAGNIVSVIGLGALIAAGLYWYDSRRKLLGR